MKDQRPILFWGGDARSRAMAERLAVLGARVITYGLGTFGREYGIESVEQLEPYWQECRAILLPMPAFDVGQHVPFPYDPKTPPLDAHELFGMIGSTVPVYGGRISPSIYALAADFAVTLNDYAVSEEVQIRNAVPTAEGAIALAMEALDITLCGARVAVLGYGRIGTALARRLQLLGAHVTVGARKGKDLARAQGDFCQGLLVTDAAQLASLCEGYDVIFNTIPCRLLTDEMLAQMPERTVLIELASPPGGWDGNAPSVCRRINGQGLPGKYAPRTAGMLLADALWKQLERGD